MGLIIIGVVGFMSFSPFWEPVEVHGWARLAYASLAIWAAFIVVGLFRLAKSFRHLTDRR